MNRDQIMAALSSDENVLGNSFDDDLDADPDYNLSLSVSYFINYTPPKFLYSR